MVRFRAPRGMEDILPPKSGAMRRLEDSARKILAAYGYEEIILPVVEQAELYLRSIGEETDIVQKEMFLLEDKGGRILALRPEATAGVARAFVEHGLDCAGLPVKLFYVGPMFRHERPQAGRYRQFHQLGVELIGPAGPEADAETILLVTEILGEAGIPVELRLNTVGDALCRPSYLERLVAFLESRSDDLCEDCRRRMIRNPLRVLDCKEEGCREVLREAPLIHEYLCQDCRSHWEGLLDLLGQLGMKPTVDPLLVRGLDYYTRTVYELISPELGAQNAVAAGGRYDDLIEEVGGRRTPAVGFSLGMERALLLVRDGGRSRTGVYVISQAESARREAFLLGAEFRRRGLRAEVDVMGRSFRAQLREADRRGFRYAAILGEDELEGGFLTLKDLESGEQRRISREEFLAGDRRGSLEAKGMTESHGEPGAAETRRGGPESEV